MDTEQKKKFRLPAFLKKPSFLKKLRKTLIILLIITACFGAVGVFIGYFYEDAVKSIIISQLNQRLNCRIEVKDIEFSVFSKFPYASVHFIDATVYDAPPDTLTEVKKEKKINHKHNLPAEFQDSILLKAKDVYLQMSLLDLLFSKYRIKRIEVDDGKLSLKVFKNGTDNYHFLKPSTDTTSSEDFKFDLQKVILKNVAASYVNLRAKQNYKMIAKELILKGAFSEKEYDLDINGDVYVHQVISNGDNYFSSKNAKLDLVLKVNDPAETVTFTEGLIDISGLALSVTGFVAYGKDREEISLNIKGENMPLQSFLDELPWVFRKHIDDYKGKGTFTFNAEVSGTYKNDKTPLFSASFSLSKGEITQKKSGITLENVALNASYFNGKNQNNSTSVLDISNFSAKLKKGGVSGSFKMQNFNHPEINLIAKGNFDLTDLHEFIGSDTISAMSGAVDFDFLFRGELNSLNSFTAADFVNSHSSGTLNLADGNFEFKNNKIALTGLNGRFSFSNNDIISENFKGNIGKSDFTINGYFRNVLSYLFLIDESLQVDADFNSRHIDMDDLLQYKITSNDTVYRLDISPKLDFNFKINVRNFVFGKFVANNISGQLKVRNRQALATNVAFGAMDGRVTATGLMDASQSGKLLITCDAKLYRVDIRKMFYEFGNFGQDHLMDENLKGLLTANIQFGSVWSNTLDVDLSTVYANADITIEDGELINYTPIVGLSKQLKNRDFSDIKFATLKTQIGIKDKIINIPATEIKNDVIDFEIQGTHTFENQIDYHVSVLYSELLNKNKNKQTEFGQVEDDGLHNERYFFRITGTTEDPIYQKIDKEAYKEHIVDKIKTEGENLKDVLNNEFGWFKKNDTIKGNKNKKPPKDKEGNQEFKLEWEDDDLDNPQ
jgi:hypothetical protein